MQRHSYILSAIFVSKYVILLTWEALDEQKYDILANTEDIHIKRNLALYGPTFFYL